MDTLPPWWGMTILGWGRVDWKRGVSVFQQLLNRLESDASLTSGKGVWWLPDPGFLLTGLYETAAAERAGRSLLEWAYPKVLNFHQYLHRQRDPEENGLLAITNYEAQLLLPFHGSDAGLTQSNKGEKLLIQAVHYNALLAWSNECLIDIGAHLGVDTSELIDWNELTVYSLNHQLWDEQAGRYRAYNLEGRRHLDLSPWDGFIPLIAEIPNQDQAEVLLQRLEQQWPALASDQAGQNTIIPEVGCSMIANWLLYYGLWRFGMQTVAERVRRYSLELMDRFGFRAHYPAGLSESAPFSEAFPVAAALCLDWLDEG